MTIEVPARQRVVVVDNQNTIIATIIIRITATKKVCVYVAFSTLQFNEKLCYTVMRSIETSVFNLSYLLPTSLSKLIRIVAIV